MITWGNRHKYTVMAAFLGIVSVFMARQWDYDLWEVTASALNAFDLIKGHEIMFLGFFVVIGFAIDINNRRKRHRKFRELSEERVQAMKATMTTVNDIVNNALNSLQIFRLEAEKNAALSPGSIHQFDAIIFDTASRLKNVHDLDVFVPHKIAEGLTGIREN